MSNASCFRVFKGQKPITAETEKSVCGSRLGQTPNKSPFLLPLRGLFAFFRGGGVVTWEHCDLSPRVTEATYFSGGVEGSLIHVSRRLITVTVNIFTSITPHVSSVYEAETPVFIDSGAFSP